MVTTTKVGLRRNGVQDFVSLRGSSIVIAAYTLFIAWFFLTSDQITYTIWRDLFAGLAMKVFTLITLIAVMVHSRIGLWQVLSDYVKAPVWRTVLQYILNIIALGYVVVGLFVLWGV